MVCVINQLMTSAVSYVLLSHIVRAPEKTLCTHRIWHLCFRHSRKKKEKEIEVAGRNACA